MIIHKDFLQGCLAASGHDEFATQTSTQYKVAAKHKVAAKLQDDKLASCSV